MQVVILAGGKGTRLAERLKGRPKPLIDVDGVPLLQRQIEALRDQGARSFLVLVNHAADQIASFCTENGNFGCEITLIDDGEPRGTSGAVLACLDQLEARFLVVYGDTLFDIDVARFVAFHEAADADGTLFLHPNDHPHDSDLVEVSEGLVTAFHPYPHPEGAELPNQVNAAFYMLERSALEAWRDAPTPSDFGKDIFPAMLAAGARLAGYSSFEYIKDLGTPKRLDKVERHLRTGVVDRASRRAQQACVFLDRDGTLNMLRGYVRSPEDLVLIEGAAEAVKRLNELEYRAIVVTNQPVLARGDCDAAGLRAIHNRLETVLGRSGAFLDGIYVCPHHPDAGFEGEIPELKIRCNCRKPQPGLIVEAARDMNCDLSRSWMIGDTTSDILAAHRAGVSVIMVQTGEAGGDRKYPDAPDFVAADVSEAVSFIETGYGATVALAADILSAVRPGALVLIGGLARSGKSTLASVVERELRKQGVSVLKIALDRWIVPADERGDGDVTKRFDNDAMLAALQPWLAGGDLAADAPFYDRVARARRDGLPLEAAVDSVVIVEGVPALLLEPVTDRPVVRVHVDSWEPDRQARVESDLLARLNLSPEAARAIYLERQGDEAPVVESARARADLIVNPMPGPRETA
jgi:histidinol-phosphate phosphatase family protein